MLGAERGPFLRVLRALCQTRARTKQRSRPKGRLQTHYLDPRELRRFLSSQRVLKPRQRDQEERCQHDTEQHVDPDKRGIERAHAESSDQSAEGSAEAVFHDAIPEESLRETR